MTLQKLASLIAFREGKRKQEHIGNIRETLKIICQLQSEAMLLQSEELSPLGTLQLSSEVIFAKALRKKPKK